MDREMFRVPRTKAQAVVKTENSLMDFCSFSVL